MIKLLFISEVQVGDACANAQDHIVEAIEDFANGKVRRITCSVCGVNDFESHKTIQVFRDPLVMLARAAEKIAKGGEK